jgi:hypothetical protein
MKVLIWKGEKDGENTGNVNRKVSWNLPKGALNGRSPCVEEGFEADVYVMALFTPFEELPDLGIDTIKILFLGGIPRFKGRKFYFCRSSI